MSGSGVRAGETGGRETANAPRPDTHEWAKNQAKRQRVPFRELANGFASCYDVERLQAICDRFGPADVQASSTAGWRSSPPP